MDFMLQWFWVVGLLSAGIAGFSIYKAIQTKKKVWIVSAISFLILMIVSPVKMDVNTKATTDRANEHIEQTKVLPPKVSDDAFAKEVKNVKSITEEELK